MLMQKAEEGIKATTGIQGIGNPQWTGQVQIDGDFQAMSGAVAEADKGSVTLKGLGILTWSVSSS